MHTRDACLTNSDPRSASRTTTYPPYLTYLPTRTAIPTTIAYSISSQWFPSQRGGGLGLGLATGLISLGAPLGGIFFSLVLQALFSRFGADWMSAGLVLPAVLAGFVVPACALVRTNPAGLTTTTTTTGGTGPASDQHADPEQLAGIRDAEASELVHTRGQDILFVLKLIEFWLPTYALLVSHLPTMDVMFIPLS